MKLLRYILVFFLFIQTKAVISQVVINEYSCSNWTLTTDNYGDHEDWIELYNTSINPVNIGGYYLSDRSTQPTKWRIPSGTTINGQSYRIIWASGRNVSSINNLHTNFRLSQTKFPMEEIVLSDSSGIIIDHVNIDVTKKHNTHGRYPNGGSDWRIYITSTPNSQNLSSAARLRYAQRPVFNTTPGFYNSPLTVAITTSESNATIHYTTDGSEPNALSAVYTSPVMIDSTTVLKAITVTTTPSISSSFVCFGTYFINEVHTLPVVSIAADELVELADGNSSLRPEGTIEYFDINRILKTAGYGEFNSHGQDSWALDQRSLDFIMRDEFGYNYALQEQLFNLTQRDEFQRVILRASGDDNYPAAHHSANEGSAHLRDAYVQNLAKTGGLYLDVRVATKTIVYINGIYWGVYDIREIPDDHDYTEYYYNQGKFDLQYIETWGGTWAEYGGNQALTDWADFHDYAMTNDMTNATHWNYVTSQLDVKSLVDYVIVNSITVCSDWLNYNTGWWRGLDSAGQHKKWGYILWDNDAVFGFYNNYTRIPNKGPNAAPCNVEDDTLLDPEHHIDLLNKLRENISFNQYYISRYIDLSNTVFSCDNMLNTLDSISDVIDPEMTRHAVRWSGTYSEWKSNLQQLRDYIELRCQLLPDLMDSCYNLTGPYPLYISSDPIGVGKIKINSITIHDFPWTGNYHGGIPVYLNAIPDTLNGFSFDKWETFNNPVLPSVFLTNSEMHITTADTLIAHFKQPTTYIFEFNKNRFDAFAYPTIFNNETFIQYSLQEREKINIVLYSSVGLPVLNVKSENNLPGIYQFSLKLNGKGLSSGIYFLNFKSEKTNKTIRLMYVGD